MTVRTVPEDLAITPKQALSIGQALAAAPGVNVWEGAVRSGKTVGANLAYAMQLATDPGGDGEYAIFGRTRETINRNILAPLQNPQMWGLLSQHVKYNQGAPTAQILGRTVHVIGTSNVTAENTIRGMTIRKSLIDEGTLIPEETFNMIVSRHSVNGSWIGLTTNPDHSKHYLKKNYIDRPDLHHRHWHFTLRDNEHNLPEGFIPNLEAQYTGLWRKRYIDGLWVAAEGAVYPDWEESRYVVKHEDIPEIVYLIALGIDYGDTHATVGILLGLGADDRLYALDEWVPKPGAPSIRVKGLHRWLERNEYDPEYIFIDPAAAAFKNEMLEGGFTNGYNAIHDVNEGVKLVASLLATDQLLISERCELLRDEIPGYVWDSKVSERLGIDQVVKADDDACDALRYAIVSSQPVWRPWIRNLEEVSKAPRTVLEAIVNAAA